MNSDRPVYPLGFAPVYQDYLWGGTRIPAFFGRAAQPGRIAESWEVSDRDEGMSRVTNGPLRGTSLRDLLARHGQDLTGPLALPGADGALRFPWLIKLIDAAQTLSVQVHPDERTAPPLGAEPKTEMWYVLDAAPGAHVYLGLRPGVDRTAFLAALEAARLETVLHRIDARPGMTLFVPAGTVHAIGAGCLLLEVQQNSNTTYRVYDWGRVDANSQPRPLHLAQALQATDWSRVEPAAVPAQPLPARQGCAAWRILDCPFFSMRRYALAGGMDLTPAGTGPVVVFTAAGALRIEGGNESLPRRRGDCALLPAALPMARLTPECAGTEIIVVTPPEADHIS